MYIETRHKQTAQFEEDLHSHHRATFTDIFIEDGCEGYSPSIAITAKTEMTSISNKPGRQTFFIGFNGLYQANPFLGISATIGIDFINKEQAEKLAVEFTEIKGLDMDQFRQTIQDLEEDIFEMPSGLILGVMVVSVVVILVTIAIFIWKMYQMRGTLGKLKDIPNVIKSEPNISGVKKAGRKAREMVFEFQEGATKAAPLCHLKPGMKFWKGLWNRN